MTEVKGVGRRRTQLFDDFRNRRRYWELKAEDRNDSLSVELKEKIHYLPKVYRPAKKYLSNNNLFINKK